MFRYVLFLSVLFCPTLVSANGLLLANQKEYVAASAQPRDVFVSGVPTLVLTAANVSETVGAGRYSAVTKTQANQSTTNDLRPNARKTTLPRTRWQHMEGHVQWTRAALSALKGHGRPLVELVPADIENWCPAYPQATEDNRAAFWVGFLSALAKHESTYKPWAVGGGGKWYGLLQILPGTARGYKCNARTGRALKDGGANLSCAIRIMARTVPRDGVIHGYKNRKGRGVTADWGPMHSAKKRRDMAGWLREQNYCKPIVETRPKLRPDDPSLGR